MQYQFLFLQTLLPIVSGHVPAGAALKQLAHYGQSIVDKEFRRYDYGALGNLRKYGRFQPPRYDLSKISAPVFLHYSQSDPLAKVEDVDRLFRELGNPVGKFLVQQRTFSHLDFLWGIDANEWIHRKIINFMHLLNSNEL